jgi:hypothetical protein
VSSSSSSSSPSCQGEQQLHLQQQQQQHSAVYAVTRVRVALAAVLLSCVVLLCVDLALLLQRPCTSSGEDAASCLSGFSIQGNFESARRNYTRVWAQMDDARSTGMLPTTPPARPFHLHLVGRGDVKTLGIPPAVANMTTVHFNLKFPQYYDQVSQRGVWSTRKLGGKCVSG